MWQCCWIWLKSIGCPHCQLCVEHQWRNLCHRECRTCEIACSATHRRLSREGGSFSLKRSFSVQIKIHLMFRKSGVCLVDKNNNLGCLFIWEQCLLLALLFVEWLAGLMAPDHLYTGHQSHGPFRYCWLSVCLWRSAGACLKERHWKGEHWRSISQPVKGKGLQSDELFSPLLLTDTCIGWRIGIHWPLT